MKNLAFGSFKRVGARFLLCYFVVRCVSAVVEVFVEVVA